jgi:hypothetical protein
METTNETFFAILDAANPESLMECPDPRVVVKRLPYNRVRLVGEYEPLMSVLVGFVGMTSAEADILIERMS